MGTKSSNSSLSLQPSAALCSFCLLILVSNAYPQTNESICEPYQMQTLPANPGDPVAEVVVDKEGVELLWRSHFGFSKSTAGGTDTDGDGFTDADESDHWTDPWTPDAALAKSGSPELRRQAPWKAWPALNFSSMVCPPPPPRC